MNASEFVGGGAGVVRTKGWGPHDEKQYRVAHTLLELVRGPIQFRILGTRSSPGLPVAVVVPSRDEGKDD